ncbi:MAG: DUF1232 domain-containing protein [Solirubrobacterales bacterium]
MKTLAVAIAALLVIWLMFVAVLLVAGRRPDARRWARIVPDCAVLLARLMRDRSIGRGPRAVALLTVAYLAMPIDLVPDFIPVAGQLDDIVVVLLALRMIVRLAGDEAIARHWPDRSPLPGFLASRERHS